MFIELRLHSACVSCTLLPGERALTARWSPDLTHFYSCKHNFIPGKLSNDGEIQLMASNQLTIKVFNLDMLFEFLCHFAIFSALITDGN